MLTGASRMKCDVQLCDRRKRNRDFRTGTIDAISMDIQQTFVIANGWIYHVFGILVLGEARHGENGDGRQRQE